MENDVDVTEYIAKMLLDGEWGGHVEFDDIFSEFYRVQIQIFDSIGSKQPITTVTTPNDAVTIRSYLKIENLLLIIINLKQLSRIMQTYYNMKYNFADF